MPQLTEDWMRQAERDFQHAKNSFDSGEYEWVCFASQQPAEKALKALYSRLGGEGRGHSLLKLLKQLPDEVKPGESLVKCATVLDKFYIPSRHPESSDSGSPMDYFSDDDARSALNSAEDILEYARSAISR